MRDTGCCLGCWLRGGCWYGGGGGLVGLGVFESPWVLGAWRMPAPAPFSVPVPRSPSPPFHAPAGGGVVAVLVPNSPQYPNTAGPPDEIPTHATPPAATPWYLHQWAQAGLRSCRHTPLIIGLVQGQPAHSILMSVPYSYTY